MTIIFPQEKTIELKDVMGGTFRYDRIGSYQWINNQDAYYFSDSDSLGKNFYRYDLARGDTTTVFSIKKGQLDRFSHSFSKDQTLLLLKTNNVSIWRHSSYGTYHVYNIANDTITPVSANPDSLRNVKISPDNQYVSYVRNDNNLYLFSLEDLEELCDLAVRALDEIIDYQEYPVEAAKVSTQARRSLGIGYIGLAHYLAKNKSKYEDKSALKIVDEITEAFQYYLLKASNDLAKEKGACELFNRTKYSSGILPIDTYKKDVDEIVKRKLSYNWEHLREEIQEHGLRHSTLSAQMPSESSSIVSNATNGVEPPRDYLSIKKSKKGPLKQIVPDYNRLKNFYTLLWDMKSNDGYINLISIMQKYFDQAISGNWSYNPENYKDGEVPTSVMANDFLNTYKFGWKTSYYQNTYDFKGEEEEVQPAGLSDVKEDDDGEDIELELKENTLTVRNLSLIHI